MGGVYLGRRLRRKALPDDDDDAMNVLTGTIGPYSTEIEEQDLTIRFGKFGRLFFIHHGCNQCMKCTVEKIRFTPFTQGVYWRLECVNALCSYVTYRRLDDTQHSIAASLKRQVCSPHVDSAEVDTVLLKDPCTLYAEVLCSTPYFFGEVWIGFKPVARAVHLVHGKCGGTLSVKNGYRNPSQLYIKCGECSTHWCRYRRVHEVCDDADDVFEVMVG